MAKGIRTCPHCGTRLLIVRGVPALNWGRDPAGRVAVTIHDPVRGRFLAKGEQPGPLEHAYSVHKCDGQQARPLSGPAFLAAWRQERSGQASQQRNRRGKRGARRYLGFSRRNP
jgi:hypothetical protein